jgi:hypothetical protein
LYSFLLYKTGAAEFEDRIWALSLLPSLSCPLHPEPQTAPGYLPHVDQFEPVMAFDTYEIIIATYWYKNKT